MQRIAKPYNCFAEKEGEGYGRTDSTVPTQEGHYPIKGSKGRYWYRWNIMGRRHDSCVRYTRCGKALCIVT